MRKPRTGVRAVFELALSSQRRLLCAALLAAAGYAAAETLLVSAVQPLAAGTLRQAGPSTPIADMMINAARAIPGITPATAPIIVFAIISALSFACTYAKDVLRSELSLRVRRDTQLEMFTARMGADYGDTAAEKQGDLLFRLCGAPGQMGSAFSEIPELAAQALKVVGIVTMLFFVSSAATLVLAAWFVLFGAFHSRFVSRAAYRLGAVKGDAISRQNVVATESLNGIRELRVYNAAARAAGEYRAAADQLAEAMRSALVLRAVPSHALPAMLAASGAVGLAIAEAVQPSTALTILPAVATFAFAALRLMPVIGLLAQSSAMVHESLPQVEVVALEIASPPAQAGSGTAPVPTSLAAIRLDRVDVRHRNGAAALSDITLAAERGQVIAIGGPSGAGKSTLLDVLAGIRRPVGGKVMAMDRGGATTPLDTVDPAAWSAIVGIVSQEQALFHGTIEENIRFGRNLAEADVRRAARLAAIDTFVDTLPEGYRTLVGHRGLLLSGGQRQRILIARALANTPTLLLFDEATSALDSATEQQIQDTVRGLAEGRIVVQVAHRPAIIEAADSVWMIDAGRIVSAIP